MYPPRLYVKCASGGDGVAGEHLNTQDGVVRNQWTPVEVPTGEGGKGAASLLFYAEVPVGQTSHAIIVSAVTLDVTVSALVLVAHDVARK